MKKERIVESITEEMKSAIEDAIPGAVADVQGNGGHFIIDVVSGEFEGKRIIAKHRMVLMAIAHLMKGDNAPVHAVDKLICRLP